jgi:hypothetical protein
MKALKRKEIIEIWKNQSKSLLNYYCCPHCRDILIDIGENHLKCGNLACSNGKVYNKETGEEL